jgi:hypothetical protein
MQWDNTYAPLTFAHYTLPGINMQGNWIVYTGYIPQVDDFWAYVDGQFGYQAADEQYFYCITDLDRLWHFLIGAQNAIYYE